MKFLFLVFILSFLSISYGQLNMAEEEDKLSVLLNDLRSAKNDQEKLAKNKLLKAKISEVLNDPQALSYSFSKLSTIGFINSSDQAMRIVNWNVEKDDLSQLYTCYVLHYDKRKKKHYMTELIDNTFGMPSQPSGVLSSDQWYGALYYKIIPVKKGGKTLYTVLGWDYNTSMSQLKLIDVIYFTGKTVKLGSPIFKINKTVARRVFYEHSKKATMSLRYDEQRKRIIFDHLSPESPSMAKFKSFYVPDMSYDAFELEGYKWVLYEDVIGTNKGGNSKAKKQTVYVKNEKTGKIEKKEIKTKWIDPSDPNAPAGGNVHVAVTPESAKEQEAVEKQHNEPKADKKDKRDPSQVSFYDDVKKKKRKRKKK